MTPRVGGQPLTKKSESEGSEAGSPLRAHAFSNCEREGVMETPSDSIHNSLNQTSNPRNAKARKPTAHNVNANIVKWRTNTGLPFLHGPIIFFLTEIE